MRKPRPSPAPDGSAPCRRIVLPQIRLGLAAAWCGIRAGVWRAWRQHSRRPAWRSHTADSHLHDHRQHAALHVAVLALLQAVVIFMPLAILGSRCLASGGSVTRRGHVGPEVTKRFGSHQALDGVSLEVPPRGCVVDPGTERMRQDNAAASDRGTRNARQRRDLAGRRSRDGAGRQLLLAATRARIGFVFQDLALWPHLTVRQNLEFVLEPRRRPAGGSASRVEDALRWFGSRR